MSQEVTAQSQSGDSARLDRQASPASGGALCLAASLLLTGLAYASPQLLVPEKHSFRLWASFEIINLYCLVAWMGMSHFVYSYWGQFKGFQKPGPTRAWLFGAALLASGAALMGVNNLVGSKPFAALTWIYFIPHFIRAERLFSSAEEGGKAPSRRFVFVFPTLAFTYFTFVLFCPIALIEPRWKLIGMALAIVALAWKFGIVEQLKDKECSQYALLACFLMAEGLTWGTYRQYMHPYFQVGIYVFHIAMASFYHYLRAYQFALHKGNAKVPLSISAILATNLALAIIAWGSLNYSPLPIWPLDVSTFTVWVALHLVASDIYKRFLAR